MHGGDIYRNRIDLDFSVNINPLGPPEEVQKILREGISLVDRYPDPYHEKLREELAAFFGLHKEEVVPGNGVSELLMALCHALSPRVAMVLSPGFSGYEYALRGACAHCKILYHTLSEEEGFTLKEDLLLRLKKERPEVLFLADPNNPNGRLIDGGLLKEILKVCEGQETVLVLDESFKPLTGAEKKLSAAYRVKDHKNLIVLRAFTKSFAIPGIRLGYALCRSKLAELIKGHLPEWNLSVLAQVAGEECLKHLDHVEKASKLIRRERGYLRAELLKRGLKPYPSDANYILFYCAHEDLGEKLIRRGILVRDCADYRSLKEGYYRVAVKKHEENEKLIRTISKIFP